MGDPAVAIPAEPSQSPSAAPAAPPPTETPQAPPGGPPAPSQAQPGASPKPSEIPTDVPYSRFREVQTNLTKQQREFQAYQRQQQAEAAKLQEQLKRYETEKAELLEYKELLEAHPDIAEQLIERISKGTVTRPSRSAPPPAATLPPEFTTTIQRVEAFLKAQAQREVQAQEAVQNQQTSEKLDTTLRALLRQQQYDEEFLPDIREYVLAKARLMPQAELEDVPYLAGQWLKRQEQFYQKRVAGFREAKQAEAALPATPGSTTVPVTQAPETDAFGPKTNAKLEALLRDRLGWGRESQG